MLGLGSWEVNWRAITIIYCRGGTARVSTAGRGQDRVKATNEKERKPETRGGGGGGMKPGTSEGGMSADWEALYHCGNSK